MFFWFFLFFFCFVFFLIGKTHRETLSPSEKPHTHTHTHRKPRQPEPRHIAPSTCSVDSAAQIPFPSSVCLHCRNRSPAENTPQASRIRWSRLVSGRTKGKFFIRVLKSEPLPEPRTGSRRGGDGRGAAEWGERRSRNRPGHHCGGAASAQQAVFFQSAYCLFISYS